MNADEKKVHLTRDGTLNIQHKTFAHNLTTTTTTG